MSKHTDGPWHFTKNHPNAIPAFNIWDSKGMMVGYLGHTRTPGQAEANASLIASAPDLLAALIRIMDERCPFEADTETCECGSDGMGDDGSCEHVQARQAIAKATGA